MYTHEQVNRARQVDLYSFLPAYDPTGWRRADARRIKSTIHDSLLVTAGKGYCWNSRGITGANAINFMQEFYDLSFQEAVQVLINEGDETSLPNPPPIFLPDRQTSLKSPPEAAGKPWRRAFAYLHHRGISYQLISRLVSEGLIYQEKDHNNIVFLNPTNGHFEMNTSLSERRFKRVMNPGVWYFGAGETAYICEAAIDAMSLYELLHDDSAAYISLGGCGSRYPEIDALESQYRVRVIAVDNDEAGEALRKKYPDLPHLIPRYKDWNEDLLKK